MKKTYETPTLFLTKNQVKHWNQLQDAISLFFEFKDPLVFEHLETPPKEFRDLFITGLSKFPDEEVETSLNESEKFEPDFVSPSQLFRAFHRKIKR